MSKTRNGIPTYRPDIYRTEAIVDPYPHYARMRELGPIVRLPRQRVYALPRFAECKAVLRDDATFISGKGVAAGAPEWAINNIIRRHERLPLKFVQA